MQEFAPIPSDEQMAWDEEPAQEVRDRKLGQPVAPVVN